jgi:hypothetical protein
VRFLRAALSSDLQKMRAAKIVEANMQTHPQTQTTFTMPAKPHRFVASDRVEGTPVRRSDGTKIGTIERLSFPKIPSAADSRREAESSHHSDRCL